MLEGDHRHHDQGHLPGERDDPVSTPRRDKLNFLFQRIVIDRSPPYVFVPSNLGVLKPALPIRRFLLRSIRALKLAPQIALLGRFLAA